MSDVLSAEQLQAKVDALSDRLLFYGAPPSEMESMDNLRALARSHEQLRSELREAEIATYDALAMLGEARAERDAAVQIAEMRRQERDDFMDATKAWTMRADRAEAAARAGGCAADLADTARAFDAELSEYCDGPERDALRDALSAYDRAVSGQTAEKEEA